MYRRCGRSRCGSATAQGRAAASAGRREERYERVLPAEVRGAGKVNAVDGVARVEVAGGIAEGGAGIEVAASGAGRVVDEVRVELVDAAGVEGPREVCGEGPVERGG